MQPKRMSRPQKKHRVGRLNDHLWNGSHHGCRILILNLDRYHCLWRLDCRQLDRRCLAFGLGAHGIAYRLCGFDQPLSSNSRSQNHVAEPAATEALLMAAEDRGYECWEGCRPSDNGRIRCQGLPGRPSQTPTRLQRLYDLRSSPPACVQGVSVPQNGN